MVMETTDDAIKIDEIIIPLYKDSPEYLYTDKFKNLDLDIPKEPIDFLDNIITGEYFNVITYWDKECKNYQGSQQRRSFGDLYALFRAYYPDITKNQLLSLFEDAKLHFYICGHINKVVFHNVDDTYFVNFESIGKLITEQDIYYEDDKLKGYTPRDLKQIYLE